MIRSTRGFTIAEVVVAVLILSVGLLAIAASSGSVYRMLGHGKLSTEVAHLASSRMEILRRLAAKGYPPCSDPGVASGVDSAGTNVVVQWTVPPTGPGRQVTIVITTPVGHGPAVDTFQGILRCR